MDGGTKKGRECKEMGQHALGALRIGAQKGEGVGLCRTGGGGIPQEGRKEAWALAECQSQESTQRDPGGSPTGVWFSGTRGEF